MRCRCWSAPGTSAIHPGTGWTRHRRCAIWSGLTWRRASPTGPGEYLRQAVGIFEDLGDETQAVAVRAEFPGISA